MGRTNKPAGHVFISYAHENSRDVERLTRALQAAGAEVWIDTASLWPGEDWRARIRHAITDGALVFIACFSRKSVNRKVGYQNEELYLAIEQLRLRPPDEPWLIPVRFDNCTLPELDIGGGRTLGSLQRADLFRDPFDEKIIRLVKAVLRILPGNPDFENVDELVKNELRKSGGDSAFTGQQAPKSRPEPSVNTQLLRRHCLVNAAGRLPGLWELGKFLDPVRLGVHAAREIDAPAVGGAEPARDQPVYVPRDIDPQLDAAIRAAIRTGGLVLVLGDSSAGTSRAAYEAMRRLPGDMRLLMPQLRESLGELADNGLELYDTVIWLNDLQDYLGPHGLDVPLLTQLTGGRTQNVVVLATMRSSEYLRLWPKDQHNRIGLLADQMRAERKLLEQARRLSIKRHLTPMEIERAAERAWDPRIADALEHSGDYGLAEYLAAGPELWERWQYARAVDNRGEVRVGAAIVAAALDCRRAGFSRPVPEKLLRMLYSGYLDKPPDSLLTAEVITGGLSWASQMARATSGLLIRANGGYLTFDYLLNRLQADPDTDAVKDFVWEAVLAEIKPDDAWEVGQSAYWANRVAYSERAFRTGLRSGDASVIARCALGMADLADLLDDFYEKDQWLRWAARPQELPREAMARAALGKPLVEPAAEDWYLLVAGIGGAGRSPTLVIDHEHVENHYDGANYHQITTRSLTNRTAQAIDRWPFRIGVDRYSGDPEKNRQQHERYPLRVADSAISAWHESESRGREPADWEVAQDRPDFKEIWLLFKNGGRQFPLLPGQSCTIGYEYTVSDKHWGPWSKRKIRIPTNKLSLVFSFPAALDPWLKSSGVTLAAEPTPMTIDERQEGDRVVFTWEVDKPPLNAQYQFRWRFGPD